MRNRNVPAKKDRQRKIDMIEDGNKQIYILSSGYKYLDARNTLMQNCPPDDLGWQALGDDWG